MFKSLYWIKLKCMITGYWSMDIKGLQSEIMQTLILNSLPFNMWQVEDLVRVDGIYD